jgi:hypothetical protein
MERWRVYRDEAAPGIVEVGLERLTQRRWLLGYRESVEERLLARWFTTRDLIASGSYRATLGQAVEHLARGTFGSYVDVDTLTDAVRVRLVRRTVGPRHLEVDIARERLFDPDDVAESAAHAEELRALAEDENEAYWAAAREAAAHASERIAEARQRADDAAELSRILRSQD